MSQICEKILALKEDLVLSKRFSLFVFCNKYNFWREVVVNLVKYFNREKEAVSRLFVRDREIVNEDYKGKMTKGGL